MEVVLLARTPIATISGPSFADGSRGVPRQSSWPRPIPGSRDRFKIGSRDTLRLYTNPDAESDRRR
jgi:hypothetical protein